MNMESSTWSKSAEKAETDSIESGRAAKMDDLAERFGLTREDIASLQEQQGDEHRITGEVKGIDIHLVRVSDNDEEKSTLDGEELTPEDSDELYTFLHAARVGRDRINHVAKNETIKTINELDRYERTAGKLRDRILGRE